MELRWFATRGHATPVSLAGDFKSIEERACTCTASDASHLAIIRDFVALRVTK